VFVQVATGTHDPTPTTGEYVFEATKTTISLLESIAGSTGAPFAKDALTVALALLNACEVRKLSL
jgi:hypothetical protein